MKFFFQGAFFWLSVVAILIIAPAFIYYGHESTGWAVILTGVITMLATRFDEISEISVGPLTAKLKAKIQEADAILAKLRSLSLVNGRILISLLVKSGRWQPFTDDEKDEMIAAIGKLLRDQGVAENEILAAEDVIHKVVRLDYSHFVLSNKIPNGLSQEFIAEWTELLHKDFDNTPSPEEIESFLKKANILTPLRQEILEDYKYYVIHKKHRRPEKWANRKDWVLQ